MTFLATWYKFVPNKRLSNSTLPMGRCDHVDAMRGSFGSVRLHWHCAEEVP